MPAASGLAQAAAAGRDVITGCLAERCVAAEARRPPIRRPGSRKIKPRAYQRIEALAFSEQLDVNSIWTPHARGADPQQPRRRPLTPNAKARPPGSPAPPPRDPCPPIHTDGRHPHALRRLSGGDPPHGTALRPLPHAVLRRGVSKGALGSKNRRPPGRAGPTKSSARR